MGFIRNLSYDLIPIKKTDIALLMTIWFKLKIRMKNGWNICR